MSPLTVAESVIKPALVDAELRAGTNSSALVNEGDRVALLLTGAEVLGEARKMKPSPSTRSGAAVAVTTRRVSIPYFRFQG